MWPLQGFLLPLGFPPPPFPSSLPPPPRNDPFRSGTELCSELVPFISFSPFTNAEEAPGTGFFGLDQKANLDVVVSVLLWLSLTPCKLAEAGEGPICSHELEKCSALELTLAPPLPLPSKVSTGFPPICWAEGGAVVRLLLRWLRGRGALALIDGAKQLDWDGIM